MSLNICKQTQAVTCTERNVGSVSC